MRDKLELEICLLCNNNCIYCVQGNNPINRRSSFLSFNEIKKRLDKGRRNHSELILQGGEPTIHPQFFQILEYAKYLNFSKIELITNGRLLFYYKFAKKIIQLNINKIIISVLGPNEKIHDSITLVNGSYNQTIQGIKNLKKLLFKGNILISTVMIKQNYKYLLEIIHGLSTKEINDFHFIFFIPYDNVIKNNKNIMIKLTEIIPVIKKIIKFAEEKKLNIMLENIPFCLLRDNLKYLIEMYNFTKDTKKINLNDKTLNEWKKIPSCKKCKYNVKCKGLHKNYVKKYKTEEIIDPILI
jgi:MoaA/NifB/PqqE/SkfB family radical SAM enzyme